MRAVSGIHAHRALGSSLDSVNVYSPTASAATTSHYFSGGHRSGSPVRLHHQQALGRSLPVRDRPEPPLFELCIVDRDDKRQWWIIPVLPWDTARVVIARLEQTTGVVTPALWLGDGAALDPLRALADYNVVDDFCPPIFAIDSARRAQLSRSFASGEHLLQESRSGWTGASPSLFSASLKSGAARNNAFSRGQARPRSSNASSRHRAVDSLRPSRLTSANAHQQNRDRFHSDLHERPRAGSSYSTHSVRSGRPQTNDSLSGSRGRLRASGKEVSTEPTRRDVSDVSVLASPAKSIASDLARQLEPHRYQHLPAKEQVEYLSNAVAVLSFRNEALEAHLGFGNPDAEVRRVRAMTRRIRTPQMPLDWSLFSGR